MTERPMSYWRDLMKKHIHTIDAVMDMFSDAEIPADEGAEILCFVAGMSLALSHQPAFKGTEPLARGWQFGAEKEM